jgi:acyl-CoA reductase-like NAD-dependent aldehyde dehydrogenase
MTTHEQNAGGSLAEDFAASDHRNFIGGEWAAAMNGARLEVIDPGRATVLGSIAAGGAADIDGAVAAARSSFDAGVWRGLAPSARAEILWAVADEIDRDGEQLAVIESLDNGMPLRAARMHVQNAVQCFRYFAGLADKIFGHTSQLSSRGHDYLGYTLKEPIGVAGLIVPWNAPLRQTVYKVAPALAAGCSVVLKPAEEASLSSLRLAQLIHAAGVPAGVFNVVTGNGVPAGSRLTEHPDVDKVSFTGSTEVGRQIVRAAAGNLKKLTLELGGKSPLVIFDDAELETAIPSAAMSIFGNSGQVCSAASRLIVHRSIYDRVLEGIDAVGRKLSLGYYSDADADLGPLISAKQHARVENYVREGLEAGAEIVGGEIGEVPDEGYFFSPTVLAGVDPSMAVVREEIFGPVLAALPFDDTDEAVALANDTDYGLAGSVFTRDVGRAHAVAGRIRAGRIGINVHAITDFSMPGGGYKQSGWGRENGPDAVDPYLEVKSVFTLIGG